MIDDKARSSRITFELLDRALPDIAPEVLGLWSVVPRRPDGMAASVPTPKEVIDAPVWRANYADPGLAVASLRMGEASLTVSRKELGSVPERLNRLIETQPAALDFGVRSSEEILAEPEAEFLALMQEVKNGYSSISFDTGEKSSFGWEQASHQLKEILERASRFVAAYAWVETRVQEELLGRTVVSWTGDVNTAWRAGLSPEQIRLHQRTLALALGSRDTLFRTVLLTAQLAVKVSVLLSTPGGVILALPAVWRFIHRVLAESKRVNQVNQRRITMANGLESSIREIASKVVKYVEDVSEMKVETKYVQIGAGGTVDFAQAKPVARTTIKLDGDSEAVIPLRQPTEGRFEVDSVLLDIHKSNVTTAIDYRARILSALMSAVQSFVR